MISCSQLPLDNVLIVTDDRYLIENALARLLTESHVIFLEYDENESFEAIIVIACTFSFPFPNKRFLNTFFISNHIRLLPEANTKQKYLSSH